MNPLYPLRLRPTLKEKIWGSRKLSPFFSDRTSEEEPIGEAWYTFEEAVIENGDLAGRSLLDVMRELGPRLMGDAHTPRELVRRSAGQTAPHEAAKPYFPILTKLLFVGDVSAQVHPDDQYALAHEGGPGKTEMWYIVHAEPDAAVALGLTEKLPRERLIEAAESGEIEKYLNWEPVKTGDVVFVPPGLLHTMGKGLTICEIQQNSDLTYRFYDFGRPGPDGEPRTLHVHEAAAVMRDDPWPGTPPRIELHHEEHVDRSLLAGCSYFASELLRWDAAFEHRPNPLHFQILIMLGGEGTLSGEPYRPGDGFLIPAHADPFEIIPTTPTQALLAYEPNLEHLREATEKAGASAEEIARVLMD